MDSARKIRPCLIRLVERENDLLGHNGTNHPEFSTGRSSANCENNQLHRTKRTIYPSSRYEKKLSSHSDCLESTIQIPIVLYDIDSTDQYAAYLAYSFKLNIINLFELSKEHTNIHSMIQDHHVECYMVLLSFPKISTRDQYSPLLDHSKVHH